MEDLSSVRLPNYSALLMREVAVEAGQDWVQMAEAAQLDPSLLDDPGGELTGHDELRLQRAFAKTVQREPAAWFSTGLRFHILCMGPLGMAALSSRDTQSALRNVMLFQDLCPSLLTFGLEYEHGELRALTADAGSAPLDLREQHLERGLGCVTRFLTDMWQGSHLISHVEIELDRPENWYSCEDAFGFPVKFGAQRTRWVFAPGAGHAPLPLASPLLETTYERLCRSLLDRNSGGSSISERCYGLLVRGGRQMPSASQVAQRLNMSTRTLHRRLATEGVTFRRLVDDVRAEQARYFLRNGRLSVGQIAELTGFSESASFSHAFKRWTGQSPLGYRRSARQAGVDEGHAS